MNVLKSLVLSLLTLFTAHGVEEDLTLADWVNATAEATSGSDVGKVIDGNSLTAPFYTKNCVTQGYVTRSDMNILLDACAEGYCSSSCDKVDVSAATDGNSAYTAVYMTPQQGAGVAWLQVLVPSGNQQLYKLFIRGQFESDVDLYTFRSGAPWVHPGSRQATRRLITTLGPRLDSGVMHPFDLTVAVEGVGGFYLESRSNGYGGMCYAHTGDCIGFRVTEIVALREPCYETITVDLKAPRFVTSVETKITGHKSSSKIALQTSLDSGVFVDVDELSLSQMIVTTDVNSLAQFVRLRYTMNEAEKWGKANLFEISVLGEAQDDTACPNACQSNGACSEAENPSQCVCQNGFAGLDCSARSCSVDCSTFGATCNPNTGACECERGKTGDGTCGVGLCPNNCFGQGTCAVVDNVATCTCNNGYAGTDCRYQEYKGKRVLDYTLLDYHQFLAEAPPDNGCPKAQPYLCETDDQGALVCTESVGECVLRTPNLEGWESSIADNFVPSPLTSSSSVQASSGTGMENVLQKDGFWQSSFCFPVGFLSRGIDINVLAGRCSASACTASQSTEAELNLATDGVLNGCAPISAQESGAEVWAEIELSAPSSLAAIALRLGASGHMDSLGIQVYGITSDETSHHLGVVLPSSEYDTISLEVGVAETFTRLRLQSFGNFCIYEIGARAQSCFEHLTVDLGSVQTVGALAIRHMAGGDGNVTKTSYWTSTDGQAWDLVRDDLDPLATVAIDVVLEPSRSARYIRVRHDLAEGAEVKVFVWEVNAWDANGKYGAVPVGMDAANPLSFKDLLGLNGIWAWHGQGWSHMAKEGWGPKRYNGFASHGRNYHNWHWDAQDPDDLIGFEEMSCGGGTDAQWWLDWDWEYSGWNRAGLEVQASIQFTADMFAKSAFDDPFQAAYDYGYLFAKHFGRTEGTGNVITLEVGNEPWKYDDPAFYREVLRGMASGAKAGDPAMRVLPACFPFHEVLTMVTESAVPYLDGLNVHLYSWIGTNRGRTGVHPEHPSSLFREVFPFIRFRDEHLPGLPIYLTEFGWDSAGGGEDCKLSDGSEFPECVSERSQALYAVRGSLYMARLGMVRLSWFFYGNLPADKSGVFSRSGLTSSVAANSVPKQSLIALAQMVRYLDARHLSVVREDDAYVYVLGDDAGRPTHVVGWLPIDGESGEVKSVTFPMQYAPVRAWYVYKPIDATKVSFQPEFDSALFFSGNGEHVQLFAPLATTPSTIECFIKIPSDGGGVLFSDTAPKTKEGITVEVLKSSGDLRVQWNPLRKYNGEPEVTVQTDGVDLRTGDWTHIAFVRDTESDANAHNFHLYIDGVKQATVAMTGGSTGAAASHAYVPSMPPLVGELQDLTATEPFRGWMRDLRVYGTPRSSFQSEGGSVVVGGSFEAINQDTNLIARISFLEGSGDFVHDLAAADSSSSAFALEQIGGIFREGVGRDGRVHKPVWTLMDAAVPETSMNIVPDSAGAPFPLHNTDSWTWKLSAVPVVALLDDTDAVFAEQEINGACSLSVELPSSLDEQDDDVLSSLTQAISETLSVPLAKFEITSIKAGGTRRRLLGSEVDSLELVVEFSLVVSERIGEQVVAEISLPKFGTRLVTRINTLDNSTISAQKGSLVQGSIQTLAIELETLATATSEAPMAETTTTTAAAAEITETISRETTLGASTNLIKLNNFTASTTTSTPPANAAATVELAAIINFAQPLDKNGLVLCADAWCAAAGTIENVEPSCECTEASLSTRRLLAVDYEAKATYIVKGDAGVTAAFQEKAKIQSTKTVDVFIASEDTTQINGGVPMTRDAITLEEVKVTGGDDETATRDDGIKNTEASKAMREFNGGTCIFLNSFVTISLVFALSVF